MVKLFENTEKINEVLASVELHREKLQAIHDALIALGAEALTISDLIEVVQMDGGAPTIKEIVFRGKTLRTTDGFAVNPQAIQLDQKALRTIAVQAQAASRDQIDFTRLTIEDGTVKTVTGIESQIREQYSLYATEETAAIIKDVEKICELINAVSEKMGVSSLDSFSALRNPELWLEHRVDYSKNKREFFPSFSRLVGHLEPSPTAY